MKVVSIKQWNLGTYLNQSMKAFFTYLKHIKAFFAYLKPYGRRIVSLQSSKGKDEMTSKQQRMLRLGIYPGYTTPSQKNQPVIPPPVKRYGEICRLYHNKIL